MVFGLFEGNKLTITLDKPSFNIGESITGKVTLDLKKPKKAKGLRVSVYLEYETEQEVIRNVGSPPRPTRQIERHSEKFGTQTANLDTEKEYPAGHIDYPFSIPTAKTNAAPFGFSRKLGWFIDASLDVPMSVDVGKKQQLNVIE